MSGQISPRLDARATAAEITAQAEQVRPGFADGISFIQLDSQVELQPGPYVRGCRSIDVHARLYASRADIYMARELSPDSCRWRVVMEHELRHLQIAQRALDAGASLLRDDLVHARQRQFDLPFNDFGVNSSVRSFVNAAALRAVRFAQEQARAGDLALDTDLEARQMEHQCRRLSVRHLDPPQAPGS